MSSDDPRPGHSSVKLRLDFSSAASVQIEELLAKLEQTFVPRDRATLLVEIARLLRDHLGDTRQAYDALVEALRADPSLDAVVDVLEPIARADNRWAELFETVRGLVTGETVPKRSLAYCELMVRWLTQEVPNPDVAKHYLERIRAIDATHWLVHLFQAAKYREHSDAKRELEALDRAVLSARRKDDRARIHLLMAKRYGEERTANSAEAKKHYRAVLNLDPRSLDALRGLEAIALKLNDRALLAELLDKLAGTAPGEDERVAYLLRLADLQEKQFLKPDQAARTLERAYALDPMNMEALAGLERSYLATRSWAELVRTLERSIALIDDPQTRAERLVALAEAQESKLGDLAGAIQTYERLSTLAPDNEEILGEQARLAEKLGDWQGAVRFRTRLAELAPDPIVRARMYVVAGQLLAPHDAAQSRVQFEQAVASDPQNAAAWNALLWDARAASDHARVARYLEERAAQTEAPRARAQLLVELAEARKLLRDVRGELAAYESAIADDPNNEAAARALLALYVGGERWHEAAPLCDLCIYAAERDKDFERAFQHRLTGHRIATALERHERALAQALAAADLRPEAVEAKRALVASAGALRADPRILDAREALLGIAERPAGLEADDLASLGDALLALGERDLAASMYEHALTFHPDHPTALTGLASLRGAGGEVVAAYSLKRQLAHATADEAEQYALLVECGDAFLTRAGNAQLAAEVFEEARTLRPADHQMLHKLLAAYQALERWDKVVEVVRAIVDSDDDTARKAKAIGVMAQVTYEKIGDRKRAIALFDEALDLDPSRLEAFERIVRILTADKDWTNLEAMYKRMLMRSFGSGDRNLQHALYHQLGLIYRDRLGDAERAIASFRAAIEIRPDADLDQTILRELLARTGKAQDAIGITLTRVAREPLDPGPYPALFDLLWQQGQSDRAWCVASVLKLLGVTHGPAQSLIGTYPAPTLDRVTGTLGPESWRHLLHPELDPTLTAILQIAAPAGIDLVVARLGIRERMGHPGPALKSHPRLQDAVRRGCEILGLPAPRIFGGKKPGSVFAPAATRPPSLLASTEAFDALPASLVPFVVGKNLARLVPPLLARATCPSLTELTALLASAIRVGQGRTDEPLAAHLKKEEALDLSISVQRLTASGIAPDVARWSRLADLISSRVGLVLVGDVERARAALGREPQAPGDMSPREQMKDLVAFFMSDAYVQMRRELGVTLRA